jgi:hypothetical protein
VLPTACTTTLLYWLVISNWEGTAPSSSITWDAMEPTPCYLLEAWSEEIACKMRGSESQPCI